MGPFQHVLGLRKGRAAFTDVQLKQCCVNSESVVACASATHTELATSTVHRADHKHPKPAMLFGLGFGYHVVSHGLDQLFRQAIVWVNVAVCVTPKSSPREPSAGAKVKMMFFQIVFRVCEKTKIRMHAQVASHHGGESSLDRNNGTVSLVHFGTMRAAKCWPNSEVTHTATRTCTTQSLVGMTSTQLSTSWHCRGRHTHSPHGWSPCCTIGESRNMHSPRLHVVGEQSHQSQRQCDQGRCRRLNSSHVHTCAATREDNKKQPRR